jgi:hypothetical protein
MYKPYKIDPQTEHHQKSPLKQTQNAKTKDPKSDGFISSTTYNVSF